MEATVSHQKTAHVVAAGFAHDLFGHFAEAAQISVIRIRREPDHRRALKEHAQVEEFIEFAFRTDRNSKAAIAHRLDEVGSDQVEQRFPNRRR